MYQPGSRTILYESLVPTDANVHIARHSANDVNGVPGCRRDVGWFRPDLPPTTRIHRRSGHRIGECEAGIYALCSKYGVRTHFRRGTISLMRNFFPIGTNSLLKCPAFEYPFIEMVTMRCRKKRKMATALLGLMACVLIRRRRRRLDELEEEQRKTRTKKECVDERLDP